MSAFTPEFVRRAYTLAIRRAARDAHSAEYDRDAVQCAICCEHAAAIAAAEWALNYTSELTSLVVVI